MHLLKNKTAIRGYLSALLCGICLLVYSCLSSAEIPDWWDPNGWGNSPDWHYRVPITITKDKGCEETDYSNTLVETSIDFKEWLSCPNIDAESLRIVDENGKEIPCQSGSWADSNYETYNVSCNLSFIVPADNLKKEKSARYFLYFDTFGNEEKTSADYITDLKISKNSVENSIYKVCLDPKQEILIIGLTDKESGKELLSGEKYISREKIRLLSAGFVFVSPVKAVYKRSYSRNEFKIIEEYTFYHQASFFQVKHQVIPLDSQKKISKILPRIMLCGFSDTPASATADSNWWQGVYGQGMRVGFFGIDGKAQLHTNLRKGTKVEVGFNNKTEQNKTFESIVCISLKRETGINLRKKYVNPLKIMFEEFKIHND